MKNEPRGNPDKVRRVLVVEDDVGLASLILKSLSKSGFVARSVPTGAEAVERMLADPLQMLLIDQSLPDMTGQAVISILAQRGIKATFVMITGQGDERLAVEVMKFGAADYLVKDTTLLETLPGVLDRAFYNVETERLLRGAERALRESEERFRVLFDQSRDAMMTLSSTAERYTAANPAARHLFGVGTIEKFLEMNPLSLSPPQQPDGSRSETKAREAVARALRDGGFFFEWMHQNVMGDSIPCSVLLSRICTRGTTELLATVRDISEQVHAIAEREKLQVQLAQAQKMESVGRLAGGVAHDFNNMLGVILGNTELALSDISPGHPLHEELLEIRKAAGRSAALTRQLLAFARQQAIAPQVLDLNECVEGMLKMLQRLIGEDIELAWAPVDDVSPIYMDPSQIDQILANLCVNSRDAISDTGRIYIQTDTAVFADDYALGHPDVVPGTYAELCISDNGSGMDSKTMARVFDPFFSTKQPGKGTGLGLATVYGIVKQNDGFIRVESKPGRGTTFRIYLPRNQGPGAPVPVGEEEEKQFLRHKTILLAEDEPALLGMTTMMLQRMGHTVLAADSPDKALRLAREQNGRIDLLVTDVIMPEMNGQTLSKKLNELYPHIRCLFMSGYTADAIAHHGVLEDGIHFLQKPFSSNEMGLKLRDVLAGAPSIPETA